MIASVVAEWVERQSTSRDHETEHVGMGWNEELQNELESKWQPGEEFSLPEVYEFESHFSQLHPENHHVKEKLRQTLQHLRDKDVLEFVAPGTYRLLGPGVAPSLIRLGALYWKRLDTTTWNVLQGNTTQTSGGVTTTSR